MPDRVRIPHHDAVRLAAELQDILGPSCARLEVAGSIRRQRPLVADVELVAIARVEQRARALDMFTTLTEPVDVLHERCKELLAVGTVAHRPDVNGRPAFGPKFKRLLYRGFPLDLFVTTPECWGCIYLIRTGPAEFGKQLVLRQSEGGWLPRGFFFRDGRLWKLPPPYGAEQHAQAVQLATPEERDVFAALGYAFVPPDQRGETRPAPAVRASA